MSVNGHDYEIFHPTNAFLANLKSSEATVDFNGIEVKMDARHPLIPALHADIAQDKVQQIIDMTRLFIVDDQVVDASVPRSIEQKTFTHSDEIVRNMIDTLGFAVSDSGELSTSRIQYKYEFNDMDSIGGHFNTEIGYKWSPFNMNINTFSQLERIVCENLQSVKDSSLNYVVPLINDWENNLKISNQSLRHSMDSVVRPRIAQMPNQRVSLADIGTLRNIIGKNLSKEKNKTIKFNAHDQLNRILEVLNGIEEKTMRQAGGTLSPAVRRMIEVPVTAYDAYNVATECGTHYLEDDKLNVFANQLIFGSEKRERMIDVDVENMALNSRTFNSLEDAFVGEPAY